jgi:hypothetical protein
MNALMSALRLYFVLLAIFALVQLGCSGDSGTNLSRDPAACADDEDEPGDVDDGDSEDDDGPGDDDEGECDDD